MRFHAALSEDESTPHAADELIAAARQAIPDPDLVFVFFTAHHLAEADALLAKLSAGLDPGALIGCSGEGVIGPDREVERAPGIALLVAKLPGVNVHPFHIPRGDWRDMLADTGALNERLGAGEETRAIIAMADTFTTTTNQFLPMV